MSMIKKIKQIVEEWASKYDVKEAVEFLNSKQIPCAPLYTVKDVVEDDHIAVARQMIRRVDHPVAGPTKVIGSPINLSETPAEVNSPAPLLGQHTEVVLKEILNLTDAQLELLRKEKAI